MNYIRVQFSMWCCNFKKNSNNNRCASKIKRQLASIYQLNSCTSIFIISLDLTRVFNGDD